MKVRPNSPRFIPLALVVMIGILISACGTRDSSGATAKRSPASTLPAPYTQPAISTSATTVDQSGGPVPDITTPIDSSQSPEPVPDPPALPAEGPGLIDPLPRINPDSAIGAICYGMIEMSSVLASFSAQTVEKPADVPALLKRLEVASTALKDTSGASDPAIDAFASEVLRALETAAVVVKGEPTREFDIEVEVALDLSRAEGFQEATKLAEASPDCAFR